jgi:hypothetical protein
MATVSGPDATIDQQRPSKNSPVYWLYFGQKRRTIGLSICFHWSPGADDDEHYVYAIALSPAVAS